HGVRDGDVAGPGHGGVAHGAEARSGSRAPVEAPVLRRGSRGQGRIRLPVDPRERRDLRPRAMSGEDGAAGHATHRTSAGSLGCNGTIVIALMSVKTWRLP